jgi:peptide/nickel transport system substrate-binding protein
MTVGARTSRLRWASPRWARRSAISISAAAVVALAAACSSGGSASPAAGSAGSTGPASSTSAVDTLIMANAVKVDTLDPEQNSVNESIWLDQNLYSRLVAPDATGTKIVPDLATSWTVSADKLTYTFHMRNAKFSDGTAVTTGPATSTAAGASSSRR